jgi:archaellum component FlaC
VKKDLTGIKDQQGEMRKEVAFYYGSIMKRLDETKSELSSDINRLSSIQKQHQGVLEVLNEKQ